MSPLKSSTALLVHRSNAQQAFGFLGRESDRRHGGEREGSLGNFEDGRQFGGGDAGVGFEGAKRIKWEAGFDLADESGNVAGGDAEAGSGSGVLDFVATAMDLRICALPTLWQFFSAMMSRL